MASVEVTGKTVEEAVEEALIRLGRSRDEVEIQVLREGSRGILGMIGAEDARVLVTEREDLEALPDAGPEAEPAEAEAGPEVGAPAEVEEAEAVDLDDLAAVAQEVVEDLVALMHLQGEVEVDVDEEGVHLNVVGPDLGILIGRRGETLSALQFMVNQLVGRRTRVWSRVTVDVEGYRRRREDALRKLAVRVAERAHEYRQPITLEPMPPHERRIVHLALQDSDLVTTASIGEGEDRKVVVTPRNSM